MQLEDFTRDGIIHHMMHKVEKATYTNHRADRGGETKWGVIKKTAVKYQHMWPQFNWNGDMRLMPEDFAAFVFRDMFWDKIALDKIYEASPLIAERMFCISINSGARRAAKILQRILNAMNYDERFYDDLTIDGLINPDGATVRALGKFIQRRGWEGVKNLVFAIAALQEERYIRICENDESQETFMFGWSERVTNGIEAIYRLIFEAEDNGTTHYLIG